MKFLTIAILALSLEPAIGYAQDSILDRLAKIEANNASIAADLASVKKDVADIKAMLIAKTVVAVPDAPAASQAATIPVPYGTYTATYNPLGLTVTSGLGAPPPGRQGFFARRRSGGSCGAGGCR